MGLDTRFLRGGPFDQDPDNSGDSSYGQRGPGEGIVGEQPHHQSGYRGNAQGDDDGFAIGTGPGNEQTTAEGEQRCDDVGPGIHVHEVRVSPHANHA